MYDVVAEVISPHACTRHYTEHIIKNKRTYKDENTKYNVLSAHTVQLLI